MTLAIDTAQAGNKHNITGARQAYYDKISKYHLAPLWEVLKGLVTPEPKTQMQPALWKFPEIEKLMLEAGDVITAEEAERRVLVLENPGEPGKSRITNTLFAGIQLILPGEIADAHQHVASAIRFVLKGKGAYTAVEGEKAQMEHGDFIITANWAPHDHGNPGKEPVMWLDVLDMPTINHFQASFASHFDEKMQNVNHQDGDSFERYATGVLPDGAPVHLNRSPVINYPYAKMRPILERLKSTGDIDKRHGARVRYANPINGGPVLPTMGANLALLPKGFKGRALSLDRRHRVLCRRGQGHDGRRRQGAFLGRQRRVRGAAVEALPAQRQRGGGAVLDLRPPGAGSARHLARRPLGGKSSRVLPRPRLSCPACGASSRTQAGRLPPLFLRH